MPKFHTYFDPPSPVNESNNEPSCTQQHFADECDINVIVSKYMTTGILGDSLSSASIEPQYGDFASAPDFHTAQNIIAQANQAFDLLPAHLRKRFENDPGKMLEFLDDDSNREEAEKIGLVISKTDVSKPIIDISSQSNSPSSGGTEGK